MLGVLLYGSETWTTKHNTSNKLEVFHNRHLRSIMGITSAQQRMKHISSVQVATIFGMEESLEDVITARRLRWFGHLARMEDHRLPKKILFGWLPQHRPAHGTKMRWQDRVRKDMKKFQIEERSLVGLAQVRNGWRGCCKAGLEAVTRRRVEEDEAKKRRTHAEESAGGRDSTEATKLFQCDMCKRTFRRRQDMARHKCVTTRPRGQVMRLPPPSS